MRTCNRSFPGTSHAVSQRLAFEVAEDERRIVETIFAIRREAGISLEGIGFLLGADPARISRQLKGTSTTTLTNYIRIARALGYRSKLTLERAESTEGISRAFADLKIPPHSVPKTVNSMG